MSKGFVMFDKELMNSEDYFAERFTRMQAYFDLCFLASYRERKFVKRGQIVELKRGQLAVSEEELASRWKWSRNTVRKYLNEQQVIGNIEQQKNRLITITTIKFGLLFEQQIEQQSIAMSEQLFEQQIEQQPNKYNKENKDIKKEDTKVSKKETDEVFEECWVAYNRKGSKKKSFEYWNKLSDDEKKDVLPHVKVYTTSRDRQYQKDFERYLRDKVFKEIIVKGNETIYDPMRFAENDEYRPQSDGIFLYWDAENKRLIFNGDIAHLDDGYTDDRRPEGATAYWNGYSWKWSKEQKRWVKQ